ncbi:two component transcriptional regulator, LuxR family [Draconibacterium orientale]|uniref:Two component transcriptional regulator, LuxR family n=1 Tax=Draconibacterium orientale TaxID=1168034 RepID=A0A1I0HWH2_9BACT|nr:response regulator transcription factor [Draconibacterium orientale]SET88420.1 two component transcriptional regulator, LuxR family [Draconibacterium orientale]
MSKGLKIFIVDDHSLFREGLRFLLSTWSRVEEIYEAQNGLELLKVVENIQPDIVLMDIEMPELNGIDATLELQKLLPEVKVIALSMYANDDFYTDMIHAGAKGFLLKDSKFEDVQQAINEVYEGRNYFSPAILTSIINTISEKNSTGQQKEISKRESEVLYNICKGLSNQEISDLLNISKRTVDKHRENILLKTQSKNTAELVIFAVRNGFFKV